jgi:hypothetical protein
MGKLNRLQKLGMCLEFDTFLHLYTCKVNCILGEEGFLVVVLKNSGSDRMMKESFRN